MRRVTDDEVRDLIHLLYLWEYAEDRLWQCVTDKRYARCEDRRMRSRHPSEPRNQWWRVTCGYRALLNDVETELRKHPYVRAGLIAGAISDDGEAALSFKRDGRALSYASLQFAEQPEFSVEDTQNRI